VRACATSPFEGELQESALSTPESSYVPPVLTVSLDASPSPQPSVSVCLALFPAPLAPQRDGIRDFFVQLLPPPVEIRIARAMLETAISVDRGDRPVLSAIALSSPLNLAPNFQPRCGSIERRVN